MAQIKKSIKKNNLRVADNSKKKTRKKDACVATVNNVEEFEQADKVANVSSKNSINTVLFLALSLFLFSIVLVRGDNFWSKVHDFFLGSFGVSSLLLPILFMYVAILSAIKKENFNFKKCIYYGALSTFFVSTFVFIFFNNQSLEYESIFNKLIFLYNLGIQNRSAGLISGLLGIPILNFLGLVGAKIVISLANFIFLILFFNIDANKLITGPASFFRKIFFYFKSVFSSFTHKNKNIGTQDLSELSEGSLHACEKPSGDSSIFNKKFMQKKEKSINEKTNIEKELKNFKTNISKDGYEFPPIGLLKSSLKEVTSNTNYKDLKAKGETLIKILESFSVHAKIVNICKGPAVTRYELNPACGTKISKITNLADDIALNLAATDIRIEAPIPGKSALGIEVPNNVVNLVRMQELISSKEFINSKSKLTVVLGRDIAGNVKIADLAKMPHLLIAGSTGAGKSVCINSFIISLLYKASPNMVKLIMIDPKVVELGIYNGIPHLMVPVVTDPRKASNVLNWAVIEMLKRYKLFAKHNVRDLESFNNMVLEKEKSKNLNDKDLKAIPQVVIIIDELADLMMASPKEVEDSICRLAQMARAAGMHLVIATQRPSVNVITGVIKANIPSRIALAVSSQVDSRTILDSAGAEKLLGKGDMLFSPIGSLKPIRVQGCFVTDKEISSVIDYIKNKNENNYNKELLVEMEKVDDDKEYKEDKPSKKRGYRS